MRQQRLLLTEAEIRDAVEQHVLDDRELGMPWDEIIAEDDEIETADTQNGKFFHQPSATVEPGPKAASGAS